MGGKLEDLDQVKIENTDYSLFKLKDKSPIYQMS